MHDPRLEKSIRNDINGLNDEALFYEYGILVQADGKIYDEVNQRLYSSIDEWIYDYLNDTGTQFEKFSNSYGYDDEY